MATPGGDGRVRTCSQEETREVGSLASLASKGFVLEGQRVPLLGPQGIFKPAVLPDMPLSITTAPPVEGRPRPFDDSIGEDGLLRYRYRGIDPQHRDNRGLRLAMALHTPLIYFSGIVPSKYLPVWPVYILGDHPQGLTFSVAADDRKFAFAKTEDAEAELRRRYITRLVNQRLHQVEFRQRVLRAYREHCAVCRLRHEELLEAAHILPDGHPRGEPTVPNGLALCKLHHAAFDTNILTHPTLDTAATPSAG